MGFGKGTSLQATPEALSSRGLHDSFNWREKALALDVFPAIPLAGGGSRDVAGHMWSIGVLGLLGVWCMERVCACGL